MNTEMLAGTDTKGQAGLEEVMSQISAALDAVIDPCSVGRNIPAGLNDMGMVESIVLSEFVNKAPRKATVTLRITSPACTFQQWFTERATEEIRVRLPNLTCDVVWSKEFDWSDEAMSDALKMRIREKRERVLLSLGKTRT